MEDGQGQLLKRDLGRAWQYPLTSRSPPATLSPSHSSVCPLSPLSSVKGALPPGPSSRDILELLGVDVSLYELGADSADAISHPMLLLASRLEAE